MKKIYSILLVTALGISVAGATNPVKTKTEVPRHSIDALFGTESKTAKPARTKTFGRLTQESLQALQPTAAPEAFNPITEAPEGTLHTMTGSAMSFYVDWGEVNMEEWGGLAYDAVETADGEFYLKNPISNIQVGTYIKGRITDDGLSFDFPQPLATQTNGGETFYFYADILEYAEVEDGDEWITTFVPSEVRTLNFTRNEDGSYSMDEDYMLGLTCNDMWEGFGEMNLVLTDFDVKVTEVPAGLTVDYSYVLVDELNGFDTPIYRPLGISRDGDDVYINGLSLVLPDAIVAGTIDDNTGDITIPSNQLLGRYYNYYLFLMTGDGFRYYDEDWETDMLEFDIMEEPLVFRYDAETKGYKPVTEDEHDAYLFCNFGNTYTSPCEYYCVDRLMNQGELTDYNPLNPVIEASNYVGDIDPMYSYTIEFYIFGDNNKGQMLMDKNIYYNVYINDELYPITIEEFPLMEYYCDEESMVNIPASYSDDDEIYAWGSYHGIVFRNPDIRKIGIQSLYMENGEVKGRSEIVSIDTASLTDAVAESEVISTECFDLTGRRVNSPTAGSIIIKRQIHADGTVEITKIIAR